MRNHYSRAGVSHVLALSGFHLSVVYMLLQLLLFAWVGSDKWRKVARSVSIFTIWAFVAIADFPPSLVRAAIMFSLLLLSQIVRRRVNTVDVLCVTVMAMLCVNPFMLLDVGFELSVLSMLGLLTMGNWLFERWMNKRRTMSREGWTRRMVIKVTDFVVSSAITTMVCSMMTLPLVSYYFGIAKCMGRCWCDGNRIIDEWRDLMVFLPRFCSDSLASKRIRGSDVVFLDSLLTYLWRSTPVHLRKRRRTA